MDCCDLRAFPDATFDAVLDKATLDSLLCGEASTATTKRYVTEVARVLKPGGAFVVMSFGAPEIRTPYLEGEHGWALSVSTIPKPTIGAAGLPEVSGDPSQVHYVYVCTKPLS